MVDHQLLQEIEFFGLHDEEDRKSLARVLDLVQLTDGARLFERGDRGGELYIVYSGRVEISIRDFAGEKIVLTVGEREDLFGELSLLDNRPRTASATALEDTTRIVLNRETFSCSFRRGPTLGARYDCSHGGHDSKTADILRTRVSRNVAC
jgi:CRP-like cAMP-binding protein